MKKTINKNKKTIPLKLLLTSPKFYYALFPHLITLGLVINGSLGYFYVFLIFYIELIIDHFSYILGLSLTEKEDVQKMAAYKGSKFRIIIRAFIGGLVFISFFGVFAFLTFSFIKSNPISIFDILQNKAVWLAVGIYLATKMAYLSINKYKYNNKKQSYIDKGISLGINLVALIIFVNPGIFILMFLKFLPINIELIAIIILFCLKAYIDGGVAYQEKDIET